MAEKSNMAAIELENINMSLHYAFMQFSLLHLAQIMCTSQLYTHLYTHILFNSYKLIIQNGCYVQYGAIYCMPIL